MSKSQKTKGDLVLDSIFGKPKLGFEACFPSKIEIVRHYLWLTENRGMTKNQALEQVRDDLIAKWKQQSFKEIQGDNLVKNLIRQLINKLDALKLRTEKLPKRDADGNVLDDQATRVKNEKWFSDQRKLFDKILNIEKKAEIPRSEVRIVLCSQVCHDN